MPATLPFGCSTIAFRDRPLDEAVRLIAAEGFGSVDIGIVPGFCPHVDLDRCADTLNAEAAARFKDAGLTVTSLNVHPGQLNTPGWQHVADRIRRAMDLAAALRCPTVTLPAGLPEDARLWEDAARVMAERFSRLVEDAEARHVALSVEAPHAGTLLDTADQVQRFFAGSVPAALGCTFDTSHVARAYDGALPVALDRIGLSRIDHVHVRDRVGTNGMVTPGRGEIDFAAFFEALRAAGGRPSLTLELEFRSASIARRLDELRFAVSHLTQAMTGRGPSLADTIRHGRLPRLLRRLAVNPVAEIKRSPGLTRAAKRFHAEVASARPMLVHDGAWRRRWYPSSHRHLRAPRPGSVSLERDPPREVRVCVVGCGNAGRLHALGFGRLRGVRLAGASDLDHDKAAVVARDTGCRPYASTIEMVDVERPDLVAVCTPEWTHYELVKRELASGRDVFCEKILTTRLAQARELVDLAARHRRVLALNYNYRFIAGVRALRDLLREGNLGEVTLAHVKVHAFSYHHALDLVTFLFGRIASVRASYAGDDAVRAFGGTDWSLFDEDILYVPSRNAAVIFEMASGALVTLGSSYLDDPLRFLLGVDVTCEHGAASVTGINLYDFSGRLTSSAGRVARTRQRAAQLRGGYEVSFYASIEAFMNAYVKDEPAETPGAVGLFNMELEAAIARSRRSGTVERLVG